MPDHALTLLSWNVGQDPAAWVAAAAHGTDVLLLQEAAKAPAPDGMRVVAPDLEGHWLTAGSRPRPWSTAVAVRDGITADPIPMAAIDAARGDQLGVSRVGSLAAATSTRPAANRSPWSRCTRAGRTHSRASPAAGSTPTPRRTGSCPT